MAAPIAYNMQTVSDAASWASWGYAVATVLAFGITSAVALGKRRSTRPNVYRTTFCAFIGIIGYLAVYSLRAAISTSDAGYLDQTSVIWDGTTVEAGWWDFAANGWLLLWLNIGIMSYGPPVDYLMGGKRKDEAGNSIMEGGERESLDMKKNVHHWAPGHVLLSIAFMTFYYGAIALQQAYPKALWQLFAPGVLGLIGLMFYYGYFAYWVAQIPKMYNLEGERKLYRSFSIFVCIFGLIAIIMPVLSAGLSPTVGTMQTTFSLNTVIWMLSATALAESILVFFAMIYFDFIHAKKDRSSGSGTSSSSRKQR